MGLGFCLGFIQGVCKGPIGFRALGTIRICERVLVRVLQDYGLVLGVLYGSYRVKALYLDVYRALMRA